MASGVEIVESTAVEIRLAEGRWAFAEAHRAAIAEHFSALSAKNPTLFNAPVYMLKDWRLDGTTFRGRAVAADYASFIAWRDWSFPDAGVRNAFGSGAMFTSDGALVLGVMGDDTANAGLIYPPSGSLEAEDLRENGRVDVAGNIAREIAEETGLDVAHRMVGGWLVVLDGPRVALMRRIRLDLDTEAVRAAFARHRAAQSVPELADLHLVRGIGDIVEGAMPPYTQAFIRHTFDG